MAIMSVSIQQDPGIHLTSEIYHAIISGLLTGELMTVSPIISPIIAISGNILPRVPYPVQDPDVLTATLSIMKI